MSPEAGRRRNVVIPDALWARAVEAVAVEMYRTGEALSVSEYVRRALAEKIEREAGADG